MSSLDHTGSRYASVAKTRSDYGDDDLAQERDQLLQCLAALQDEERRIAALETAREKARRESWAASAKMRDAEAALRKAQDEEPSRRVYEYVNAANGNGHTEISPVDAARAQLEIAQREDRKILRLEADLDAELRSAASRRDRARSQVHAALALVVTRSPAFHRLLDELAKTWARLRGIRKAFAVIQSSLGGFMPDEYERRWQASDSLGPILTDETYAQVWREALDSLIVDPDSELPGPV
jgi:hypothetical protein